MGLPHERHLRPRLWVALGCGLPVLALAMGGMATPRLLHEIDPGLLAWVQLALTTPIFLWAGAPLNLVHATPTCTISQTEPRGSNP